MQKGIDYPGVTVSYICHDGQGNYVMNKRGVNCRDEHGAWDFGGGGVDFGETIEQTLLKEIKEEFCATPLEYTFLGNFDIFREHNGIPTHWVAIVYLVKLNHAEVQNGEPHKFDEVAWFTLDTIPTPLHTAWQYVLPKVKHLLPR